jgi:adenine deaminase
MKIYELIRHARGQLPADLLLTNCKIVNVFSGEIISGNIAVAGGFIVGFGDYPAETVTDLKGRYISPGFIDAHVHIESSMTSVTEFARAILPRGTTSVIADPHEIANVLGSEGIYLMLRQAVKQPMTVYFSLPSCVPSTSMETSGAVLKAADLLPFMSEERVVALGEMMNFPGVLNGNPDTLAKITSARNHKKPVDGHSPSLSGKDLYGYLAAGVGSDHECIAPDEALEKLRAGMHIMIREGTGARNLQDLLPIINPVTAFRLMWCTDDRHPHDLLSKGSIDSMVFDAIDGGVDPLTAIRMATLSPATYFRLDDAGAIAPGRRADMVVFSDLTKPVPERVYSKGLLVAEHGEIRPQIHFPEPIPPLPSMNLRLEDIDFSFPAKSNRARVIHVVEGQVITGQGIHSVPVKDGLAEADISGDILKIAVVERHRGTGNIGMGFVKGFGLKKGAIASTVAHDSHNIIVVGTTDEDMKAAVETLVNMNGGLTVVCDGKPLASLALPVAGLMSQKPVKTVQNTLEKLIRTAMELGGSLADPFMNLSFLALPVIPELKLTDLGLVDVGRFEIVPVFI